MKTPDGVELYEGTNHLWYWRLRVKGRIKCDGGEGYDSERNARRALRTVGLQLTFARVRVVKPQVGRGIKHG